MDYIKIGDLVTEYWLESTHFIESASFGNLYNLIWRHDLNPDSEGVVKHNNNDTSNVYQIVRTAYDVSGAIIGVDSEHAKIHNGYHFFQQGVFEVGANATINIVLETYNLRPHMLFSINSTIAGFTLVTREGVQANMDGTLLPILNNNRTHINGNTVKLRLNPTGISTAGSIIIREARSGAGGNINHASSGNVNRGNELIMKPNTKYLLTITNLGNVINYYNISHEWYEVNI